MGHGTAQGLACRDFRRVNDVIICNRVDGDGWQRGIDQQVCSIAHTVAHGVDRRCIQGVVRFAQVRQIGCRNRQAPTAVYRSGCCILFAVKRDGDGGAFGQVNACTVHAQILAFFQRIQHVVVANSVEIDRRQAAINGHIVHAVAGVACRIRHADVYGYAAITEAGNHVCRNAHAPVTGCIQYGGPGLAADSDSNFISRSRAGR